MFKVYRYEYRSDKPIGDGVYMCKHTLGFNNPEYIKLLHYMCVKHSGNTHPTITTDLDNFTTDLYCGCTTIKQLKNWFKGYNTALKGFGFNIVEYTVKSYEVGSSGLQCAFKQSWVKDRKVIQ